MRVTVIGTGYVGTVTGVCLAFVGHRVTCVDNDQNKVDQLQRGEIPIYEPFLEELRQLPHVKDNIDFSADMTQAVSESDVIFIAVGTPSLPSGEANLCYVEAAARQIGTSMDSSRFRVVVNKSTVPVGCGNLVEALISEGIAEAARQNIKFAVASNPEFLREGSAVSDSLYPDRIVVGCDDTVATQILRELYAPILQQSFESPSFLPRPSSYEKIPLLVTQLTSSEMIKYASNAFLAMKIGFANEMANISERVGADILEVMNGIGLDSRIGPKFLNAGIGWGGSCFGKDVRSLLHTANEYGYNAQLLQASLDVNRSQRQVVIQKLQEKLYILKGRTIGLLGLAFKPDTDDLRDAPSLEIAERLTQMGARVRAYDPIAMPRCRQENPNLKIQYCNSVEDLAAYADALVVVTEWQEFKLLDLSDLASRMRHTILIDGRNLYNGELASQAGFDYTGTGRGKQTSEDRVRAIALSKAG